MSLTRLRFISDRAQFRLSQSHSMSCASFFLSFSLAWVAHNNDRLRFVPVLLKKSGRLLKSRNSVVLRKKS